jgi:hypothetical protein
VIISKAELSRELHVSRARISQLISRGLPTRADGKIDRELALAWVADYAGRPNRRDRRDTGARVAAVAALGLNEATGPAAAPSTPSAAGAVAPIDATFNGVLNLSTAVTHLHEQIGVPLVAGRVPRARELTEAIVTRIAESSARWADELADEHSVPAPPYGRWVDHEWFAVDPVDDDEWSEIVKIAAKTKR